MRVDGERGGDPRRISEIVATLMASRGYGRLAATRELQTVWNAACGEEARHTQVGNLQRGVLQVVVANSALLQELSFRRAELMQSIRQSRPDWKIKDVRFRLGRIDAETTE